MTIEELLRECKGREITFLKLYRICKGRRAKVLPAPPGGKALWAEVIVQGDRKIPAVVIVSCKEVKKYFEQFKEAGNGEGDKKVDAG